MLVRWNLTVCSLSHSSSLIAFVVSPSATADRIVDSRGVKSARLDSAATRDRYLAFDWSPGAVAHVIDKALADDAALGELAERGRAFAVEYHDRDAHFNHMLKTVDAFLERAGRSGG